MRQKYQYIPQHGSKVKNELDATDLGIMPCWKRIPVLRIMRSRSLVDCKELSEECMWFKFNGTEYAIWWEKKPYLGRKAEQVLLFKTLYPVTQKRDLDKIAALKETKISEKLSIYL